MWRGKISANGGPGHNFSGMHAPWHKGAPSDGRESCPVRHFPNFEISVLPSCDERVPAPRWRAVRGGPFRGRRRTGAPRSSACCCRGWPATGRRTFYRVRSGDGGAPALRLSCGGRALCDPRALLADLGIGAEAEVDVARKRGDTQAPTAARSARAMRCPAPATANSAGRLADICAKKNPRKNTSFNNNMVFKTSCHGFLKTPVPHGFFLGFSPWHRAASKTITMEYTQSERGRSRTALLNALMSEDRPSGRLSPAAGEARQLPRRPTLRAHN
eukprot:gene14215-biopygen5099